jgi:hypothetical protein
MAGQWVTWPELVNNLNCPLLTNCLANKQKQFVIKRGRNLKLVSDWQKNIIVVQRQLSICILAVCTMITLHYLQESAVVSGNAVQCSAVKSSAVQYHKAVCAMQCWQEDHNCLYNKRHKKAHSFTISPEPGLSNSSRRTCPFLESRLNYRLKVRGKTNLCLKVLGAFYYEYELFPLALVTGRCSSYLTLHSGPDWNKFD